MTEIGASATFGDGSELRAATLQLPYRQHQRWLIWDRPMQLDKYLSTVEAADRLGVSSSYLNKLRVTGGGPPFVKIGTRVAYDPADLAAWLNSQKRSSTSDMGATQ